MSKNLSTLTKLSICLAIALGSNGACFADVDQTKGNLISTAPIIESGRLVGTITDTTASLNQTYRYPLFYKPKVNKDGSMEGEWVGSTEILPEETSGKVKILKVEDDIATIIVKTSDRPVLPVVQVPYDNIPQLKGMPHLTDGTAEWLNSKQVMESLSRVKDNFLKGFTDYDENLEGKRDQNYIKDRLNNEFRTPWSHSAVVDEYQQLNVPIAKEGASGDNSSVVAVANALNYLYTKSSGKPTEVSKSFLTWSHDAYPLNNNQLESAWRPSDFINSENVEEGERIGHSQLRHCLHPEVILVPVVSGNEHRIDLGRLLKGVQRFGVALENENSSAGKWNIPSQDVRNTAASRLNNKKIVVRCFNGWNDNNLFRDISDYHGQLDKEENIYRAQFLAFVTKEVAAGHPVIITYLKEIKPNSKKYIKQSYVVTGSGNPTHHQSLQFLTPGGKFESYDYFAKGGGEVHPADNGNPFGRLREGLPYSRSYVGWNPQSIWKGVSYSDNKNKPSKTTSSYGADHKFEVYSLGFE